MSLSTPQQRIALAKCIIFGLLIFPAIYIVPKHGRPGMTVWTIVVSTCAMAIINGALHLASENPNPIGLFLTGPGVLVTLILGPIGVVFEMYVKF